MNDIIVLNEVNNTGDRIHLYFNGLVGLYVTYGISAFLLSKETAVTPKYSDDMQMPVVVINAGHYDLLKQQLEVLEKVKNYRCLKATVTFDESEYSEWASQLRGY
jgi:hypothetical protein